jgi:outer membrane protein TolC
MYRRAILLTTLFFFISIGYMLPGAAQAPARLNLSEAIRMATDSSLSAFKAKNLYISDYWEYRNYKALRKPQMTLNTDLFEYERSLVKRYNSVKDIDEYKQQQYLYSYGDINVSQQLPFSGGTLSFDTKLARLQYYGATNYTQFTAVPYKISLSQPILGFNTYKWKFKIEPVKYEKAKKVYLQSVETISIQTVDYFFDLLKARINVFMTATNLANADTLYNLGQKRQEIGSLSLADVLALKVEVLNASNDLAEARKELKRACFLFNTYIRIDEKVSLELELPGHLTELSINEEEALKMAKSNNPDLLGYRQQLLESMRNLEQTSRGSLLSSTLTLSYGRNRKDVTLSKAYNNPMEQEQASLDLSIPIVDWGQRRSKVTMAKKDYENIKISLEQFDIDLRQKVRTAVDNFNLQQNIVKSAMEAREVARQAYEITKQRFIIGKTDVNSLTIALSRQDQANLAYIEALRNYWKYYYTIRQLTLYDFEKNISLSADLDEILELH